MRKAILSLLMTVAITGLAQKELTLEDAVLKQRSDLAPKLLKDLQWIGSSNTYSYRDGERIMRGTLGKSEDMEMVNLELLKKAVGPDGDDMKRIPPFKWVEAGTMRFIHGNVAYTYNAGKRDIQKLLTFQIDATNMEFSPDGGSLAYTIGPNLFIAHSDDPQNTQVTSDGGNGIVNGQAVHRFEFGITKGTFWSPKGNLLAFYRKDESMVSEYPLVDMGTTPASLTPTRYPMAGQVSHHVKLGIYDLRNKKTIFLNTGEPAEQYLTNIAWDPTEKYVFIAHVNREQNYMRLVKYDIKTGNPVATILEEKHDKYVEPEQPMVFLGKGAQFLWFSERDGFNHLYLYEKGGKLVRQLTKGNWVVHKYLGKDENGSGIFVSGTGDDPTQTHTYHINLEGGKRTKVTANGGTHQTVLHQSGEYLLDTYSSLNTPGVQQVLAADASVVKPLIKASNPLEEYTVGSTEMFTIPGAKDVPLHCRLTKPSHFDPAKKYPVLVYLYNGPHFQLVTDSWLGGASLWMHWMAEQGFLVFSMDGRGSMDRGLEFENAVFRQMGTLEMEDQMRGVNFLKSQDFVDRDRMAIHGWSYGGFMTTSFMLRKPGVFKVGVAGGPVIDWKYYEVMYTERYMDTPQENPEGYETARLTKYVDQLEGDLLIIHGQVDDVVVPQHSMDFLKACINEGVQVDFFTYPGHPHNVRGKDRVHLMRKVLGYILEKMP